MDMHIWISWQYYGVRVCGMCVVCTHPDCGDSPFIDHVPNMDPETHDLMRLQRGNLPWTCCSPEQVWGSGRLMNALQQRDAYLDPDLQSHVQPEMTSIQLLVLSPTQSTTCN